MNVPSGYTALDLIGFTDKGDYDSTANYVKNDLVHHNNSIWRCLVDDTTAVTPAEGANWTVYIQNGTTLNGMADVNLTTPANGDLLRYNSTSSKWENQDVDSTPTQSSTKLVQSGGVYTQLANKANTADLATVATTGAYSDLSGTPSLAAVATSGAYSDLSGTPTIPTVNDATLTIQKNGTNVETFTANSNTNKTANITVPDVINDLSDVNISNVANEDILAYDSTSSKWKNSGALGDVKQALSNGLGGYIDKCGVKNLSSYVGTFVGKTTATNSNSYSFGKLTLKQGEKVVFTCNQDSALVSNTRNTLVIAPPNTSPANFIFESGNAGNAENHHLEAGLHIIEYTATTDGEYNFCLWTHTLSSAITYSQFMICMADAYAYDSSYELPATKNIDALSYKDNGVLGAKNLFKNIATTETLNGVTFTVYDDGTVKVNGTASAVTEKKVSEKLGSFLTDGQQYILNGCPANGSDSTYKLYDGSSNDNWNDYGDGVTVTYSSSLANKSIYIRIANGATVSNLTFKPMLRLATDTDPTYQPYAMTNKELTDVAQQEIGNYMYKGSYNVSVTADGVKDRETLMHETSTAMLTALQNLADDEVAFVSQVSINSGTCPIITGAGVELKNTATSFSVDFSRITITLGTGSEIIWGRYHSTKSGVRCALQTLSTSSGVGATTDLRSDVPTSGNKFTIYYRVYKKIS